MASGALIAQLYPRDGVQPSANFATLDTRTGASNHIIDVLDFDAGTDESVDFAFTVPSTAAGVSAAPDVTVRIGYMMSSATSGTVRLAAAFKSITDDADDLDTKAYATAQTAGDTVPNAAGEVGYVDIAFTNAQADGIAAGEDAFLRITRDADGTSGTDDASGDLELVSVRVVET